MKRIFKSLLIPTNEYSGRTTHQDRCMLTVALTMMTSRPSSAQNLKCR